MNITKKILLLILSFTLIFTLFSCFSCEHADEDEDGICDKCEEVLFEKPKGVSLIEGGEAKFHFVVEKNSPNTVTSTLNRITKDLKKLGVEVSVVQDTADTIQDVEVLIGSVETRGEQFIFDKHSLGQNGYFIKIIDSKVVIGAGSNEKLVAAIEEFAEDILDIKTEEETLVDVVMTAEQVIDKPQTEYKVTAIKVSGADMRGYKIAVDSSNETHLALAKKLQQYFYTNTGYWFDIAEPSAAGKSITIKKVEADAVEGGFKISATDAGELLVECAYDNAIDENTMKFFSFKLATSGEVNFEAGTLQTNDVSVVYYEDFGAVGDGKTDDFFAIKAAHDYANISGQLVKATSGKTYYICNTRDESGKINQVVIRTNVNWTGAKFIIDDTNLSPHISEEAAMAGTHVFLVESDFVIDPQPTRGGKAYYTLKITKENNKELLDSIIKAGVGPNTTKIDLGGVCPGKVMIIPQNDSHKVYRRKGYGSFDGQTMREVIILDENGNVSADTPVLFNYTNIDSIEIYKLDGIKPITIEGGEFTTKACRVDCVVRDADGSITAINDPYYNRGMTVNRSYTTVKNVKHYIEGEFDLNEQMDGKVGVPYHGFFSAAYAADILFEDCVLTGRRCFNQKVASKNHSGTTGTYDITGNCVSTLTFKNCKQSNFWIKVNMETGKISAAKQTDDGATTSMSGYAVNPAAPKQRLQIFWGIGGTNFCKNMQYIGCELSRFDAHSGLLNGMVKDSKVNTLALVGAGTFILENSEIYAPSYKGANNSIFTMRGDYGSTWNGELIAKNSKAYFYTGDADSTDQYKYEGMFIITHSYENWYYGYQTALPSITLDDIKFFDAETGEQLAGNTQKINLVYADEYGLATTKEHLTVSHKLAFYSVEDKNGDGKIDIPDIDADGIWENSVFDYAAIKKELGSSYSSGYQAAGDYTNFNVVLPPEYIKIINNSGNYVYSVTATHGKGIDNALIYGVTENTQGGFFGSTKFYYGTGENDYYLGTGATNTESSPFRFE